MEDGDGVDNASIHHKPFLEENKHRLELLFWLPYSPRTVEAA
jgi:hypothetical protein